MEYKFDGSSHQYECIWSSYKDSCNKILKIENERKNLNHPDDSITEIL